MKTTPIFTNKFSKYQNLAHTEQLETAWEMAEVEPARSAAGVGGTEGREFIMTITMVLVGLFQRIFIRCAGVASKPLHVILPTVGNSAVKPHNQSKPLRGDHQLQRPTSAVGEGSRHREACRHQLGVAQRHVRHVPQP